MIAIRRIYDHFNPANIHALQQCREILLTQFPRLTNEIVDQLFISAKNPLAENFRPIILIAEGRKSNVLGVVYASYFPKTNFYVLDYLATHKLKINNGIGGALYERLREEAAATKSSGIFFDWPPDDPKLVPDAKQRKHNSRLLDFFEQYGARPVLGTQYENPRKDNTINYLVCDTLGAKQLPPTGELKKIIRSILENKQIGNCSPEYVKTVISSVKERKTVLRPAKYPHIEHYLQVSRTIPSDKKIALVINEGHSIHHIKDRGYKESPIRIKSILKELDKVSIFEKTISKAYPDSLVEEVHATELIKFLKKACASVNGDTVLYPEIFPKRFPDRIPLEPEHQIGYYCIDSTTPLHANAYKASRAAVNCALTAAEIVMKGRQMAYALVRPPGHHAERRYFGGFCYLNSNAVAANYMSKKGKVVILDIDYHHGNGQQNIFYKRNDVFTISIHGDPIYAYPNFTGFADEIGSGEGEGYNLNLPLKKGTDGKGFRKALSFAIQEIKKFNPTYLIIALGLDTAQGDPTGTWLLSPNDFTENGKMLAKMNLPTLIVQEGGYKNKDLGINARHFFEGLWEGYYM